MIAFLMIESPFIVPRIRLGWGETMLATTSMSAPDGSDAGMIESI
jgi:hypothetical protein